jgi:hypothetical protein
VSEIAEEANEQTAVEWRVVDDQDPPGAHGWSPIGAARAAMSVAWSASGAIGFEM